MSSTEASGTQQRALGAWLLLAAGTNSQYAGNEGYDDEPDAYYSWDSTVANHEAIQLGDRVVLWDGEQLLGASLVEDVTTWDDVKVRRRCRNCNRTSLKLRASKAPRYRCYRCGETMHVPLAEPIEVTAYRSRHDAAWTNLDGLLTGDELRSLCVHPRSIQSLRELRWDEFQAALPDSNLVAGIDERRNQLAGGHREAKTRVRIGQRQFRARLLETFGPVCAITGTAPESVLEAAHLYSYAHVGQHHDHGGLLLRRDVHRLYDDGDLAVDPSTLTIDVRLHVRNSEAYAALHGAPLRVDLTSAHRVWLEQHWSQHR